MKPTTSERAAVADGSAAKSHVTQATHPAGTSAATFEARGQGAVAGVWCRDFGANEVSLSPVLARLHGFSDLPDTLVTVDLELERLRQRVLEQDLPQFDRGMSDRFTGAFSRHFCYRVPAPEQSTGYRRMQAICQVIPRPDSSCCLIGHLRDITGQEQVRAELQTSEQELRSSEQELQLVLDVLADSGCAVSDWYPDLDSFWASENWARLLGHESAPCSVRFWMDTIHPDDLPGFLVSREPLLAGRADWCEFELRQRRADGSYGWILFRHMIVERKADGRAHRVAGTAMDITERKEAELRTAFIAEHDPLCGLPNRYLFGKRFDEALEAARSKPHQRALLFCDLDRFKRVNDTYGHDAGDRILCAAADRLQEAVRPTDLVARLDGDEFAVLLAEVGEDAVRRACKRILTAMAEPIHAGEHSINLGVSIGAVILSGDGASASEVMKRADIALYLAKQSGRNTFRLFEAAAHARVEAQSLLALDLQDAFSRNELYLDYQPVVEVSSGRVTSMEALMRWRHSTRGQISPADFIPIAEDTGLILQVGAWALREACREATQWPESVRVAVNVSTVQFGPELEEVLLSALASTGLAPDRLKLEVTESTLINDPGPALAFLHKARKLGVRIALDDFGTGYSGLSYLRRFPFDKIKIDRAFIRDIADPDAAAIVRAMVGIGERLGMGIVAEGVETAEQLELLTREGCGEVQGFFFSRPLSAGAARALFAGPLPWS